MKNQVLSIEQMKHLKDLGVEEWAEIPDYNGVYEISNKGRILSHNFSNKGEDGFVTPKKDNRRVSSSGIIQK